MLPDVIQVGPFYLVPFFVLLPFLPFFRFHVLDFHPQNGQSDWVYEEELHFNNYCTAWWSPGGRDLAFLKFDDSEVGEFLFQVR